MIALIVTDLIMVPLATPVIIAITLPEPSRAVLGKLTRCTPVLAATCWYWSLQHVQSEFWDMVKNVEVKNKLFNKIMKKKSSIGQLVSC